MLANGEGSKQAQFRTQLLATLKERGLDDMLKKELRTKILEQLKNPHRNKSSEPDSLFERVLASLVGEYMQLRKLDYAHSVFLPEVGYEGKTLTRPELTTLFSLQADVVGQQSSLLEYFCGLQLPGSTPSCSQACQTSQFEVGYSLEQRMELIDQKHVHLASREPKQQSRDQASLRKEIETELKQYYDREIRRFRQFELETVRLEEFERARKRSDEMKARLEETYRKKCEDLRKRERRLLDEHQNKLRELDLQRSQHQHQMKKELDLLDLRQRAATEQAKLSSSERQVEQDKYRRLQEELQHKIGEYDKLNSKAADTIRYEVNLVRLAMQKEYQDKDLLTLEHKKAVDAQYYKMMSVKDSVETITRENNRLVEQNRELRKEIQEQRSRNQQFFEESKRDLQRAQHIRQEKSQVERQLVQVRSQLERQSGKVQKLQQELSVARRQLDEARDHSEKLRSELEQREAMQQPNMKVPVPTQQRRESAADELGRRMEQLRRQRKKQIEKMKLEMIG